jgi:hypothetical protein
MHIIPLDATNWTSILDFFDAVLPAIGAPAGHGHSVDALIDSMIWGGMNALEPPYTVRISGTGEAPENVRDKIELVKQALAEARAEFRARQGHDVEVQLETYP